MVSLILLFQVDKKTGGKNACIHHNVSVQAAGCDLTECVFMGLIDRSGAKIEC